MWDYKDYLYARSTQRTIEDIKILNGLLGNPEQSLLCIQIAGTNGKGSTSAMLSSIIKSAGYKTGLNTSPALVNVTERIRIDDKDIDEESFARYAWIVKEAEERSGLRFGGFDRMTACALLAFKDAGVEVAVLETGLGGRRDAVTAVETQLTAITSISFDHMQYLGNTIESITAEKCGIMKPGVPVVCHPQAEEAERVILEHARNLGSKVKFVDESKIDYLGFHNGLQHMRYDGLNIRLPLLGSHQRVNAACAIELALKLREPGFEISDKAIIEGILGVRWNCRMELIKNAPNTADVMLDGAHNPDGMRKLADALCEYFPGRPVTVLLCVMQDKDAHGLAEQVARFAKTAVCTTVNERSMDTEKLKASLECFGVRAAIEPDSKRALARVLAECASEGLVVVAGSLFLAGEVRNTLLHERSLVVKS